MATQVADPLTTESHKVEAEPNHFVCDALDKFFTLTLDMLFIAGLDGYFKQLNAMCEKILGFTNEEFLSKPWLEFIHPDDRQSTVEQLDKLTICTNKIQFENRCRCQDGSYKWLLWNVTLCQDQELIYAVVRDNTECKLAQKALQDNQDELEKRVEERTAELIQINELLKQEIVQHERTEALLRQSKAGLKKQAEQLEAETRHARSLLQELQRTQAQLIHTEKMSCLGQLVAGVAHEINNPVSFIYGNIDYANCYIQDLMNLVELYCLHYPQPVPQIEAQMKAIDFDFLMADLPKLLTSMKVGANRIRQVVLSLQNFLRAEQPEIKPTDIHEGIDSTLLILQHRLKATVKHPEITVLKEYGTLPLVECYAGQLNQVFMHLVANAIDVLEASPEIWDTPRHITIRTGVKEMRRQQAGASSGEKIPHAVIWIADNGPGISEEVRRRLFDPFFTTRQMGKGTGLGLSISYQIVVEKHGGQLTCASEPGKGAEFAIAIPIQQHPLSSSLSQCA